MGLPVAADVGADGGGGVAGGRTGRGGTPPAGGAGGTARRRAVSSSGGTVDRGPVRCAGGRCGGGPDGRGGMPGVPPEDRPDAPAGAPPGASVGSVRGFSVRSDPVASSRPWAGCASGGPDGGGGPAGRGGKGARRASVLIRPPVITALSTADRRTGQARSSPRGRHSTGWRAPRGNRSAGRGGSDQNVPWAMSDNGRGPPARRDLRPLRGSRCPVGARDRKAEDPRCGWPGRTRPTPTTRRAPPVPP